MRSKMKIPEKNVAGRVLYFMGTLLLLFNLIAVDVESKLEDGEPLLDHLVESGMINQEMVELLQSNCMGELLHTKKTFLSFDSHSTVEKSSDELHNAINNFLPLINQVLIDCVREKNLIYRMTEKEKDPNTWYEKYFGFLLTSNRRVLAQTPIEPPAPSPSFGSPGPSPSMSSDHAQNPSASPPHIPFFPPDLSKSNLHPSANEVSSNGSNVESNGHKTSKRTVIIAVVVTATVTLLVALLLFFFWQRCCGKSGRRNDERPLLSLSLSDYSIASPHKSFGLGTSIDEEKLGNNQSFNSKPNYNNNVNTNYYMESHAISNPKIETAIVNASFSSGGNLEKSSQVSISPVLPPLKPPPGRTNPPKPPPSNASPPPPEPPAFPFSGGPQPPPAPLPSQVKPPSSAGGPRPPPPPPRPGVNSGPRPGPPPPPLPGGGAMPPRPPHMGPRPPRPLAPGPRPPSSSSTSVEDGGAGNKAKLKPFFWDKVLANPDQSMVWHQIKSGSFQFNEEMIESLFGYAPSDKNKNETKKESSSQDIQNQFIRLIDPKKAQNLAIMLKALNVTTEEVCDSLEEGNELPAELIQTLLKMAPTNDEELKLRLYNGDVSQLGPAERFLKVLVDIPHAFKRLESLLFMSTIQEDVSMLKESFEVLEAACTELRKSRLFLKLLEAVLKTGNRMNDGTFRGGAQAFKLDTLLKLSDVKGTDGKTTLLHFVVQEIIRSEGIKALRKKPQETNTSSSFKSYNDSSFENTITEAEEDSDEHFRRIGLQVVSGLTYELENVKKAANLDLDSITTTVSKLRQELKKSRDFSNNEMKNVSKENGFYDTLKSFVRNAEVDVMWSLEEEKRIMSLVKSTADYFHGNNSGRDEGLRLFVIVRDFLMILDKVCKEVKDFPVMKANKTKAKKDEGVVADSKRVVNVDHRQMLFPAIEGRRVDSSSSDEES